MQQGTDEFLSANEAMLKDAPALLGEVSSILTELKQTCERAEGEAQAASAAQAAAEARFEIQGEKLFAAQREADKLSQLLQIQRDSITQTLANEEALAEADTLRLQAAALKQQLKEQKASAEAAAVAAAAALEAAAGALAREREVVENLKAALVKAKSDVQLAEKHAQEEAVAAVAAERAKAEAAAKTVSALEKELELVRQRETATAGGAEASAAAADPRHTQIWKTKLMNSRAENEQMKLEMERLRAAALRHEEQVHQLQQQLSARRR